jgi:hypothetical protein
LRARPELQKPAAAGDSEAGYQTLTAALASEDDDFATRILVLLRQYGDMSVLPRIADSGARFQPLVTLCLRQVAESESWHELLTPDCVLENWRKLKASLNDAPNPGRFREVISRLVREAGLCDIIEQREGGFSADEAELYLEIFEAVKEGPRNFSEWCSRGLEGLPQDVWNSDLSNSFCCARLAMDLAKQGHSPELGTRFADALVEHCTSLLTGKRIPPHDLRADWPTLLGCFRDNATRIVFRTRLLDALSAQDGQAHAAFFEMYGAEISDPETLASHPRLVSHFFSPAIKVRNVDAIRWINDSLGDHGDLLRKVRDEAAVQEFENRIRDCMSVSTQDEAQSLIGEIAHKLGIVPETTGRRADRSGDDPHAR